jgi:SSS family solute:Na+ symporter
MAYGTYEAYGTSSPTTKHFGSSLANFPFTHTLVYIAVSSIVINIVVSVVLTVLARALRVPAGTDGTTPDDYGSGAQPSPEVAATADRELAGAEATPGTS